MKGRLTISRASWTRKERAVAKLGMKALGENIIVQPDEAEKTSKGGIVIPDVAKNAPACGTVLSVGAGAWQDGKRIPMPVEVGQRVWFGKYQGTDIEVNGEKYKVLRAEDCFAVEG